MITSVISNELGNILYKDHKILSPRILRQSSTKLIMTSTPKEKVISHVNK